MKKNALTSLVALCLCFSLLAATAKAAVTYWDPQGTTGGNPYTGSMTGTWDDISWSTANTGLAAPVGWVEGTAACFGINTGNGTPAFTVTMDTDHSVAGIFDGSLLPNACNVTIVGNGTMTMPGGLQGFSVRNPSDGSLAFVTISNVLAGAGAVTAESTGQLFLNGTNTYTGGTLFGYSGTSFSGTINFNNSASFGTGSLIMSNGSGSGLVLEGTAPVTITNALLAVQASASLNITGNVAGLTFSGPWSLINTLNIGSGGAGNLVTISGVMSGAGGFNKYNPSTLLLTATNTFTGGMIVSNGTVALGATGVLKNTVSITLVPGANGTVFDVSAIPAYTLGTASTLVARGTGTSTATAAKLKGASGGTVSLGVRPLILAFTPTAFAGDTAHPPLYVSQGSLILNNNTITVTNLAATPLGVGTYRLIQVSNGTTGVITGTPNPAVSVAGTGLAAGTVPFLAVSNGNLNLVVKPNAIFSALSTTQSNIFGLGAASVTLAGKVSAGSVYPVAGESVTIAINGGLNHATIKDATGDFAFSFDPSAIPYSGTAYNLVYTYAGDVALGAVTNNSILTPNAFFLDDSLPGFFSGLNLFFTNAPGISMSTWSTTNPGLPVTDWTLEGPMPEQPLNDGSGKSRYSINVTPATSLVYYISGRTVNWPHLSPTGVQWITTDFAGDYTLSTTNLSLTAAGVFGFPLPPTIVQPPVNQTVLAGKNVGLNVTATGSQPMGYQWYFNTNTPLAGVPANSLLTLTGVTSNAAGNYTVLVTNQYGSAVSTPVTLTVLPQPVLSSQLTPAGFQLSGLGVPGNPYWVQSATNLNPPVAWTTLATNTADSNGLAQFTNTNTAARSSLFYRLVFP